MPNLTAHEMPSYFLHLTDDSNEAFDILFLHVEYGLEKDIYFEFNPLLKSPPIWELYLDQPISDSLRSDLKALPHVHTLYIPDGEEIPTTDAQPGTLDENTKSLERSQADLANFDDIFASLEWDGSFPKDMELTPIETPLSDSPLLSLPAELRTHIYGYVLVDTGNINVPAGQYPPDEPAILKTCHQVREEARGIYYKGNEFKFSIDHFDASRFLKWVQVSVQHKEAKKRFLMSPSSDWNNLMRWLEAYYKFGVEGLSPFEPPWTSRRLNAAAHLFDLVARLRRKSHWEWKEVAKVLGIVHNVFKALDVRWR